MERIPQLSTACSEIAFAGSCMWAYNMLCKQTEVDYQFGKWWFLLEMISALLGAAKHGHFAKTSLLVEKYHRNFSWLTMAVGVPCLGAQFCILYKLISLSQVFQVMALITFVIGITKPHLRTRFSLILPAVVFFLILGLFGFKESNFNLCYAVLLLVISTAIGTKGTFPLLDLHKIDIFHYLLVLVNYFIAQALLPT